MMSYQGGFRKGRMADVLNRRTRLLVQIGDKTAHCRSIELITRRGRLGALDSHGYATTGTMPANRQTTAPEWLLRNGYTTTALRLSY
jgi:hypothetical protein